MELVIYFVLLGTSADNFFIVIDVYRDSEILYFKGSRQHMSIP